MKKRLFYELIIFIFVIIVSFIAVYFALIKFNEFEIVKSDSFDFELEEKLKNLIKEQLVMENNIITDPSVTDPVIQVADRLYKNIDDLGYELDIVIVDSPIVNAGAFPGGLIVIYTGLLKSAASFEEISAVLAHEIGHVSARDSMKAIKRQLGLAVVVASITGGNGGSIVGDIVKLVVNGKYSREQERDADDFAFRLLIKSGINPVHFANFLQKLDKISGLDKNILKYISTHPDTEERIKYATGMSDLFRGEEEQFDMNFEEYKSLLPTLF